MRKRAAIVVGSEPGGSVSFQCSSSMSGTGRPSSSMRTIFSGAESTPSVIRTGGGGGGGFDRHPAIPAIAGAKATKIVESARAELSVAAR
jgi:hypothetical protein